jgi:hypothetical protein
MLPWCRRNCSCIVSARFHWSGNFGSRCLRSRFASSLQLSQKKQSFWGTQQLYLGKMQQEELGCCMGCRIHPCCVFRSFSISRSHTPPLVHRLNGRQRCAGRRGTVGSIGKSCSNRGGAKAIVSDRRTRARKVARRGEWTCMISPYASVLYLDSQW